MPYPARWPQSERHGRADPEGTRLLAPGPAKEKEGTAHPGRDAQFRYLNKEVGRLMKASQPVISVDTKKKELVGEFSNGGRELQPVGEPTRTKTHDFVDKELGRAVPYGVYDLANDEGWVSVGDTADTATFAVESIRRWWATMGQPRFPDATKLLITADARRVERTPVEALEGRTGQAGRGNRPRNNRLSLPTGDVEMEQVRSLHRFSGCLRSNQRAASEPRVDSVVSVLYTGVSNVLHVHPGGCSIANICSIPIREHAHS